MRNIPSKSDGVGDTLSAAEFNSDQNELENVVTSADISLDAAGGPDNDLNMLAQAIAVYAEAGCWYSESGAVNAYVLSRSNNLKTPPDYYDGMVVAFLPGNTNTGASTVNVAGLGIVSVVKRDGAALAPGDIIADTLTLIIYVEADTEFRLASSVVDADKLGGYAASSYVLGNSADNGTVVINVEDANFCATDLTEASGDRAFIWRDYALGTLKLGTTNAKPTFRSDVDFNSYNLENCGNADVTTLEIGGTTVTAIASEINAAAVNIGSVGGPPKSKVIEIGDWDMDNDGYKSVSHGLSGKTITGVVASIRNDTGLVYPMPYIDSGGTPQSSIGVLGSSSIALYRVGGGTFDAPAFSSTSYNRGWITIHYID